MDVFSSWRDSCHPGRPALHVAFFSPSSLPASVDFSDFLRFSGFGARFRCFFFRFGKTARSQLDTYHGTLTLPIFKIIPTTQQYEWGKKGKASKVAQFAASSQLPGFAINDAQPYAEVPIQPT